MLKIEPVLKFKTTKTYRKIKKGSEFYLSSRYDYGLCRDDEEDTGLIHVMLTKEYPDFSDGNYFAFTFPSKYLVAIEETDIKVLQYIEEENKKLKEKIDKRLDKFKKDFYDEENIKSRNFCNRNRLCNMTLSDKTIDVIFNTLCKNEGFICDLLRNENMYPKYVEVKEIINKPKSLIESRWKQPKSTTIDIGFTVIFYGHEYGSVEIDIELNQKDIEIFYKEVN